MKRMKRAVSWLMALVMVFSLLPTAAFAAGTLIDAAIFCSDVHGNPSTVTSVFNGIKSADSTFNPTTASFVGDTQCAASSVTSAAQEVYSGVQCIYAFGNHDDEGNYGIDDFTGLSYGSNSTNYYIYTISENSMASTNPDTSDFTSTVAGLDKTKPLFIISHLPLHSRRGDSNGAAVWYPAISAAAESMDIFFFWAHNHTGDNDVDRAAYYVAKNGSETITLEDTTTVVTPNFTYANAGYIDPPNTPARNNVATAVRIYKDSVNLTVYNARGELSGTYAVNETVTREFADSGETVTKTLSSIAVTTAPTKTTYNVGDTFSAEGLVVTATYSDDSTKEVTGYALSEVDMTTAGTKTVTVTYTEGGETQTATFDITVNAVIAEDAVLSSIAVSGKNEYSQGEALALTVTATFEDGTTKTLSADEYTVTGYNANTTGDQTVTVSYTYGDVTKTAEYTVAVSAADSGEDVTPPTGDDEDDSNSVTVGGTVTSKKTVYVLTSSISSGNSYLIVNGNSAGSYYALANNSGSVAATGVTVKSGDVDGDGDTETYIELTDATDELWTVGSGYTFKNGSYYVGYTSSYGQNRFGLSTTSRNWSYSTSNNRLSTSVGSRNPTTYYLRYNNDNGWTWTSQNNASGRSVYFYVPTEITTTVDNEVTYTMRAEDLTKVVTDTSKTAALSYCLQGNGTDLTTLPSGDSYSFTVLSDESKVIESIGTDGTVTFTGTEGSAKVKVAYTWTQDGQTYTVYKNITVKATEPTYTLDITSGGNVVTGTTIAQKGVTASTTLQLGTQIQFVDEDGAEIVELPEGATIEWHIPEEYHSIATVGHETGLISFKGVDGAFYVTATLTVNGKDYTAGVNISATTSQYSVPSDGATDFPEYPNEGAIRFDKTATAVGNFSETGIAQVELSMTGVPYTTGSEIDVVVMLDMTGSMSDDGMEAAELATIAFMEKIVKNEDGTYNENRIAVYAFNSGSSSPYELVSLKKITSDAELATATTAIKTASNKQTTGGTPFDEAAAKCQSVLAAAKTDGTGNDRQQFCVFMSDGGPTTYEGSDGYTYYGGNASGDRKITSYIGGYTSSTSSSWTYNLPTEYYTDQMKADGVTVYTVGLLLQNAPGNPSPYSSMTDSTYNSTTDSLTTIGSHYYFTSKILKAMATDESKYIDIFDVDNADKATAAFESIALSILQAATDITVEDKITDEYTMIFDIPEGSKDITGVTNDFYIEFGKYALDDNHERTTFTSVTKVYLQNTNGVLSAKDATAPVFEQKLIGEKGTLYYWSTNADDGDAGISVTSGETTYYFVSHGMEEAGYNMTSGAYASGSVNTTNMSEDVVIATPYFVYNAATKMLYWTVDKLDTEECVLRYFLYLDDSATEMGTSKETDPGSYPTNEYAYITYTNFKGNDCRQEFPKPQLTWNGAQVSYVFYLVNAAGQPINKSGQVVDFANATFITDVYTTAVVWNKAGETSTGTGELSANWLADDLLPDQYEIYDEKAHYALNVYENADGSTIKNQFTISGGTAAEISASLNSRLKLATTTASISTTKVYNTKAGQKISAYGTYTSADSGMKDIDFANTTVAFAVVWQPRLVEDVVVVDYGLDVLINVVENDLMQNTVSGIGVGNSAYGNIEMNTGVSTTSELKLSTLTFDGNTISIENENAIRFHQGDMIFDKPVTFYYETPVEFWEGSDPTEGFMYSSVTVIPATTIYYEDEFLTLESYTVTTDENGTSTSAKDTTSKWTTAGTASNATQAQDRPGASQISADLDADNVYGYDAAYKDMSTYSMGSAAMISVDAATRGEATFTFYGTGFDVIGLTSNATGTIIVQVYSGASTSGTAAKSSVVDTYYGYTQNEKGEWITSPNNPNALYQVPVMKMSGLTYGQYTVKIVAGYNDYFNHTATEGGYDLYLDAIRIYDPAGVAGGSVTNTTIQDAYKADKEAWPQYIELRNNIIAASNYTVTENEDGTVTISGTDLSGAIFIDSSDATASITDYVSYGPNNELYLKKGQSVAFALDQTYASIIADVQVAVKLGNGSSAAYEIYNAATDGTKSNVKTGTLTAATDLYYSIKDLASGTIVISNTGDGILSITNIKVTYTQNPYGTASSSGENLDDGIMTTSLYADEEVATAAVMSLRSAPVVDEPETPEEPETPVKPDEPDEPVTPDEPETPVEPDEPEAPEEPEIPDAEQVVTTILKKVINTIKSLFGWLFK